MYNAHEALRVIAILIYPFMPTAAEKMMAQLGISASIEEQGMGSLAEWGRVKAGTKSNLGPQLFPRIDEKETKRILADAEGRVETAPETPEKKKAGDEKPGQITIEDLMKIDLRTGKILEAEKVKKSKKLVKLKIDIGSETRQVVAGIAEAYEPDQLIGRTVVMAANLKPAKLMGVESQGMILAASDGDKIVLAGFDQELPEGTRVK